MQYYIYHITGGYRRPNQILHRLSIKTSIYLGHISFYCLLPLHAGLCQIYWNHFFYHALNYREMKPLLLYTTTQPEGNKKYIYIYIIHTCELKFTYIPWYRPFLQLLPSATLYILYLKLPGTESMKNHHMQNILHKDVL